ncbi:SH3 domain-containing kinase-binding protein 1 isoform X2 [Lates calcarifer]|uniref:SH3 domain-containing kinase-binding protein 1 isoform X2 n=1 Tax=Lates calcarifer TaxID=8187 RepID=A0AAJ8BMX6_LATCA|nr:SH3 domain-containing kinase-binding protein 1 isoform X2 [Lates calcarifer]XP_050934508.1 SH3 domain-containing kinase-binding protein 1 isoform X2 [Lates calcarifer]
MGSYSSVLIPDTEEFHSIVSVAEKLNEQVAHAADERLQSELQTLVTLMMEEERKENQTEELDVLTHQENSLDTSQNGSALPAAVPKSVPSQSFSSLLPKALSAVLHPTLPPGLKSEPGPSRNPAKHTSPNLEQLQTELRDLRDQFEQMKTQHNKEIKLLMNELDEEKRIRLTLQMEIQRMKKRMSK